MGKAMKLKRITRKNSANKLKTKKRIEKNIEVLKKIKSKIE